MYGTIDGFKEYCDSMLYSYADYTDAQIEKHLSLASMKLDAQYRGRFIGERYEQDQANEFPRKNAIGSVTGYSYADGITPDVVDSAAYEIAYQMALGIVRGVASTSNSADIKSETKSLTSGFYKQTEYVSGLSPYSQETQVYNSVGEMYLYDLVNGKTGGYLSTIKTIH
jgi:hypothetical protein